MASLSLLPMWLACAALGFVLIVGMGRSLVGYKVITQPLVVATAYGLTLIVAHAAAR